MFAFFCTSCNHTDVLRSCFWVISIQPLAFSISEMKRQPAFTFPNLTDNEKVIRAGNLFLMHSIFLGKKKKKKAQIFKWHFCFYKSAESGIGSVSLYEPLGHHVRLTRWPLKYPQVLMCPCGWVPGLEWGGWTLKPLLICVDLSISPSWIGKTAIIRAPASWGCYENKIKFNKLIRVEHLE